MKNFTRAARRSQRGVAAVEFALILPSMVLLMVLILLFGRLCWHYTVALKAAHDAALVLAFARKAEMTAVTGDGTDVEIAKLARSIAQTEMAQLYLGIDPNAPTKKQAAYILIECDDGACNGHALPSEIKVKIEMRLFNVFLPNYTDAAIGTEGYWLSSTVKMQYGGY